MTITPKGTFKPGLKTTMWLHAIGITHIAQVNKIGVIRVCGMLKAKGFPVSVNMAYGLQADLMGTSWNKLPDEIRTEIAVKYHKEMG